MTDKQTHDDGGPAADKTLLDWFAGMALAGIEANGHECCIRADAAEAAEWAYEYAAAMIAEKRRRESTDGK